MAQFAPEPAVSGRGHSQRTSTMPRDLKPRGGAGTYRRPKHARAGELRDAALALFVEKGSDATLRQEIAARAGIAKGTLSLYFPSKEKLLKAIIGSTALEALVNVRPTAERDDSGVDALRRMLLDVWTHLRDETVGSILKLAISGARRFPENMVFWQRAMAKPLRILVAEMVLQGLDRGELRKMDADVVAHSMLLPMFISCLRPHVVVPGAAADGCLDEGFIAQNVELVLLGLSPAHGASVQP